MRWDTIVKRIQAYVPGYEVIVGPKLDGSRVMVMVKVRGCGDYLPSYAGNLDIITGAAVEVAETISRNRMRVVRGE